MKKIDTNCKRCGRQLLQVHKNTKFCDDCRQYIYNETKKNLQEKKKIERSTQKVGNCMVCGIDLIGKRKGSIVCDNIECKKERLRRNTMAYYNKKLKPYPHLVCRDCGLKASNGKCFEVSTWHVNKCEVCGEEKEVTESRDFFYPKFKGHQNKLETKLQDII